MPQRLTLDDLPPEYREQAVRQIGDVPVGDQGGQDGLAGRSGLDGQGGGEAFDGPERRLQADCEEVLRAMSLPFYHPFDARRSNPGWPDLTVALPGGRVAFIELKNAEGEMSMEQRRVMGSLIALGHYYGVARSVGQMIAMLAEAQGMAAGAPITSGP
jgi:hypothetical protein